MDLRGLGLSEEDLAALGYDVQGDRAEGDPGPVRPPASEKETPLRTWAWTLVILLFVGWAGSASRRLPDPVAANRPDTVFSSGRAMSQLVEIARLPRPPGSPEHDRVLSYLTARLRSLGLDPQLRSDAWISREDGRARVVLSRNVLVRIPGEAPTGTILLTAHYDSPPLSSGAGDDGIGVAALLEVARALSAGAPLRNDLLLLLADGGALDHAGVRAFTRQPSSLEDVALAVTTEMRGVSGPILTWEFLPDNHGLVQALASTPTSFHAASFLRHLASSARLEPANDPWREAGVPVLGLTSLRGQARHDQVTDRAGAIGEKTLQHTGSQLLALTRRLGSMDLTGGIARAPQPNQAYFTLPWLGLVHHSADWGPLLSLGLLCAWVLLTAFARAQRASYRGMLAGLGLGLLLLGGSAAMGWGLAEGVRGWHNEYGIVESAFFRDDLHYLLLVALVVTLCSGVYGLARLRFRMEALVPGALAIPVGLAAWWGFRIPMGATTLQWAVAASILSAGLFVGLRRLDRSRGWLWATVLLLTGGILALLVPGLELLAGLLTFRGAAWVGSGLGIAFLLMLPAVEWLLTPHRWWLPSLASLVAGGLFVASLPSVQGPRNHPTFTTLVYLVDEDMVAASPGPEAPAAAEGSGAEAGRSASEAGRPASEADSTSFRRVAGQWVTALGPGGEWARSWVPEEAVGDEDPGELFLPPGWNYEILGLGPETHLPLPLVRTNTGEELPPEAGIQVTIEPRLSGEMVGVNVLDDGVEIIGVNGIPWATETGSAPVQQLVEWGKPQDGAISLDLRLPPGLSSVRMEILEHHLRAREVLGEDFFTRDPTLLPNARAGSDRVIQRTRVSLQLGASEER